MSSKDQPQPAADQEAREIAFRFAATEGEKRARPREKEKDRRAEMRDPTSKEQRRARSRQVGRFKEKRVVMKKIAHMVERNSQPTGSRQSLLAT